MIGKARWLTLDQGFSEGLCRGVAMKLGPKVGGRGNSLVVQWLGLQALTARGLGSIPSQGTKIPQAA